MLQYSLLDIYSIKDTIDESYKLDDLEQSSIDNLVQLLNLSNYKQKPVKKEKIVTDEGKWIKKEPFKITQMEKKEGIDEMLDNYRGFLNKMVTNNFEEQQEKIDDCITTIMQFDDNNKYDMLEIIKGEPG